MQRGFLLPRHQLAIHYLVGNNLSLQKSAPTTQDGYDPNKPCHLLELPAEILEYIVSWVIFGHIGPKIPSIQPCRWSDMFTLTRTCKTLHISANDERIWRKLNERYISSLRSSGDESTSKEILIQKYRRSITSALYTLYGNGRCFYRTRPGIFYTVEPWTRVITSPEVIKHVEAGKLVNQVTCMHTSTEGEIFGLVDGTIVHKSRPANDTILLRIPSGAVPLSIYRLQVGCFVCTSMDEVYFWTEIEDVTISGRYSMSKLARISQVQSMVTDIHDDESNAVYQGDNPAANLHVAFECEQREIKPGEPMLSGYRISYGTLQFLAMDITMTDEEMQRTMAIVAGAAFAPVVVPIPNPPDQGDQT